MVHFSNSNGRGELTLDKRFSMLYTSHERSIIDNRLSSHHEGVYMSRR